MFTRSDGAVVDFYSNGGNSPGIYGAVVWAAGDPSPDYTSAGGLTLAVPEPSTWAMMVLGFGGLGFAGYRASRKAAAIAA
ncbi:MAG TPA: PEPxxWA-CTERM sorting domain-containing protein [Roseiarcus sp.]|jgi:hypothetical protein|nr:PEPxxWA-CTERM sorting domain-containing protein [Roseiarcus sp.]